MEYGDKSDYLFKMYGVRKKLWEKLSNLSRKEYTGFEVAEESDRINLIFKSGVSMTLSSPVMMTLLRTSALDQGEYLRVVPKTSFEGIEGAERVEPKRT